MLQLSVRFLISQGQKWLNSAMCAFHACHESFTQRNFMLYLKLKHGFILIDSSGWYFGLFCRMVLGLDLSIFVTVRYAFLLKEYNSRKYFQLECMCYLLTTMRENGWKCHQQKRNDSLKNTCCKTFHIKLPLLQFCFIK